MEKRTLREKVYKQIGLGYEDSVIAAQLQVTVDIVGILREELEDEKKGVKKG